MTTALIVVGAILCTAAHGAHGSPQGLFWFMTIARGITGVVSITHTCAFCRLDGCGDAGHWR